MILNPGTDGEVALPSKIPYRKTVAGDTIRTIRPSAGGYGDPRERDPAAVQEDILDGMVSEETATRCYDREEGDATARR
jgi:N-methylhydantoinase B/oxoprolinase/acetone carboxylase alpha subunit